MSSWAFSSIFETFSQDYVLSGHNKLRNNAKIFCWNYSRWAGSSISKEEEYLQKQSSEGVLYNICSEKVCQLFSAWCLTLSWWRSLSMDWFLYERDLRNERVKRSQSLNNPAAEKIKN